MHRLTFAGVLVVAALLVSATSPIAQGASPSGAIFTTTVTGAVVNENHFNSKCAVYLDGGPGPNAPADAAGLPDGEYYFQVTDPSGRNLLSTDIAANRRFEVADGLIVDYTGAGGPGHPTGLDQDHLAVTIQLANVECSTGADFLSTPNNGGVYKVWATPVADFEGDPNQVDSECGGGCYHGFVPKKSKTDNFKVTGETPTFCLNIKKVTIDQWGVASDGGGWVFEILDPTGVTNTLTTGDDGMAQACGLTEGGPYIVTEVEQFPFVVTGLVVNGVYVGDVPSYTITNWSTGDVEPNLVFTNTDFGGIQ